MNTDGSLYATEGPVPAEDAERAERWMEALEAKVHAEAERVHLLEATRNPNAHAVIKGA
jgi:hypothetical protein